MDTPTLFPSFKDETNTVHPELLRGALDTLLDSFMNEAGISDDTKLGTLARLKAQVDIMLKDF